MITGSMEMEKGKLYPVSIVYDHTGATSGHMILKWEYGEGGPEVIGEDFFRHSRGDRFLVDRMLIRPAEDNGLTKQRN